MCINQYAEVTTLGLSSLNELQRMPLCFIINEKSFTHIVNSLHLFHENYLSLTHVPD